jgi:hypothetical protein
MLYREITAVWSQIDTKHINALWGQNVELLSVKLAVHKVACLLQMVILFWRHETAYLLEVKNKTEINSKVSCIADFSFHRWILSLEGF